MFLPSAWPVSQTFNIDDGLSHSGVKLLALHNDQFSEPIFITTLLKRLKSLCYNDTNNTL